MNEVAGDAIELAPVDGSAPHERGSVPGQWVREAAGGDGVAWSRLVDHYSGMLWSIARSFRLGSSDAADVVQTTWLRLVEHLGRIEQPDRIGAWLATTARNECLASLRRSARATPVGADLDDVPDRGPSPDNDLLADERDAALWAALEGLSEMCRSLLRLLANDPPPSYTEIGAALSMPVGSIGPTRARCLEQMRRRMNRSGELDRRRRP